MPGSVGPSGPAGKDGTSLYLVDGANDAFPVIGVPQNFSGGDATVLIDGSVYYVSLPSGVLQPAVLSFFYTTAGCAGTPYTGALALANFAIVEEGRQAPGMPVYAFAGPARQVSYVSQSDGAGGCEPEAATQTLIPLAQTSILRSNLPGPFKVERR